MANTTRETRGLEGTVNFNEDNHMMPDNEQT